jgi:uroporphyrinogen-III synthase
MRRILITRSSHQASDLADRLRALGVEPILIPTIALEDPTTFEPLDDALGRLDSFHWLLFTSANAVEAFCGRAFPQGLKPPASGDSYGTGEPVPLTRQGFGNIKIAAIGPATARAVTEILGRVPDLVPPQAVAESLAEVLLPHAKQGTRFLLVRAEAARDHLPETLRAAGAEVIIAPAYRTVIPAGSAEQLKELFADRGRWPDAITFTSSSTVANLFALLDSAGITLPLDILRASIGPITSQTLRDLGYPPQVEAAEASVLGLVEALGKVLGLAPKAEADPLRG